MELLIKSENDKMRYQRDGNASYFHTYYKMAIEVQL